MFFSLVNNTRVLLLQRDRCVSSTMNKKLLHELINRPFSNWPYSEKVCTADWCLLARSVSHQMRQYATNHGKQESIIFELLRQRWLVDQRCSWIPAVYTKARKQAVRLGGGCICFAKMELTDIRGCNKPGGAHSFDVKYCPPPGDLRCLRFSIYIFFKSKVFECSRWSLFWIWHNFEKRRNMALKVVKIDC